MKRLSYEQVKTEFEKRGWVLLDSRYEKSQVPMRCRCDQGHETMITWNNFQRGQGCKFCAGNVRHTYEDVQKTFAVAGCELLSATYVNLFEPLAYRCKCGTVATIRFADFKAGGFCKECKKKTLSVVHKTPDDEIRLLCTEQGCVFIRSYIKSKRTYIAYRCKCGLEASAMLCNYVRYPNCPECGKKKKSGANCYMWNPDREEVARNKYWRKACERVVRRCLKKIGKSKQEHTHELLGYTPKQLHDHIMNHPNGTDTSKPFHIDHVFPVQAFIDHGIFDLRIMNCLANLQPLPGPENLAKADNYDKEEFRKWLRGK